MPKRKLGRLTTLGGLTGRMATRLVSERVGRLFRDRDDKKRAWDETAIRASEDFVKVVSQLKGAAMKAGQYASAVADTIGLPEQAVQALNTLHKDAEPIPVEQIRRRIESELERPMSELFASFDDIPLGTASLGQAHRATLPDGRDVVVKVLHEGIAEATRTDLFAVRVMLQSMRGLGRTKAELDDIFDELRQRLEEELDYVHEAANIETFRQAMADFPVRIPQTVPSYSTSAVLTMDRLEGLHLEEFLALASPEARERASKTLTDMFMHSVFRKRILHADPHPGNFLFTEDGELGLLDFGTVKHFNEFWIGTYAEAALAALDGDETTCMRAVEEMGAWDGKAGGPELWSMLQVMSEGFTSGPIILGERDVDLMERMRPHGMKLIKFPNIRAPQDVIMLHRALGGLYGIQKRFNVEQDFGAALRKEATFARDLAKGRL